MRLVTALVAATFATFAAFILRDLLLARDLPEPYWIADWQINYAAGFVRRGLLGELARLLYAHAGVDMRTTILVLQAAAFVAFFSASALLLAPVLARFPMFAFAAFGPLAFPFKALDLHPGSTGAKEIVLLASLALQAALSARFRLDLAANDRRLWGFGLLWAVLVLAHEGFFFFLPFSLLILLLTAPRAVPPLKLAFVAIPPAAAFAVSALFHGDATYTAAICASLADSAPTRCTQTGAIAWLGNTAEYAVRAIYYASVLPPFIVLTSALAATLGAVGLGLMAADRTIARCITAAINDKAVFVLVLAGFALPLSLALVFSDHGRLLHIWFTSAAITIATGLFRFVNQPAEPAQTPALSRRLARPLWIALFVGYATTWSAQGPCCPDRLGSGFIGRLHEMIVQHL